MRLLTSLALLVCAFGAQGQRPVFDDYTQTVINESGVSTPFFKAADFDGDGTGEIIFDKSNDDRLYMTEYDDNWQLPEATVVLEDFPVMDLMEIGDVDGDGDTDLVVRPDNDDNFYVYPNNGDGTFSEPLYIGTGTWIPRAMQLADVDNDGDLDLVTVHGSASAGASLRWYRNDGEGAWNYMSFGSLSSLRDVTLTDIDGDQDLDAVVLQWSYDVWLFTFDGSNFSNNGVIISSDYNPHAVNAMDVDSDGDQDLIVSWNDNDAGVVWNENTGDLANWPEHTFNAHASGLATLDAWCADMDNDGDRDLLLATTWWGFELGYFSNNGDGQLGGFYGLGFGGLDNGDILNLELVDVDGDGYLDILYREQWSTKLHLKRNITAVGCMDVNACNFDPYATEAGTCHEDCGCYDEYAINHDADDQNQAGCLYMAEGYVFHDLDLNGFKSTTEPVVANQPVLTSHGMTAYTDDDGYFAVQVPQGLTDVFPSPEGPFSISTSAAYGYNSHYALEDYTKDFGITAPEVTTGIEVSVHPTGSTALCDALHHYVIVVENTGSQVYSGEVTLTYDPLFQGYAEMTPINNVVDNALTWSFEALGSGSSRVFNVRLQTPTVAFIGEPFAHQVEGAAFVEESVVASHSDTYQDVVSCAYDPNDKLVFPLGFGEDHRLLAGTTQEFIVRFQNTGNAPANDVVVRDTLDVDWDLASLEITATSHSAQITVDPVTREMVFLFENIQLPDSTCCEPLSHGLLSYRLRSKPELAPETRLENTAYIYFDNNPPIVTNTTWTTVHACQESLEVSTSIDVYCLDFEVLGSTNYAVSGEWEVTGLWNYAGNEVGTGLDLIWSLAAPVDGTLQVVLVDPLCSYDVEVPVVFDPGTLGVSCPTDLNCDGVTGAADLVTFLGAYPCTGEACPFDLDGDNSTGIEDMLEILGAIGVACP